MSNLGFVVLDSTVIEKKALSTTMAEKNSEREQRPYDSKQRKRGTRLQGLKKLA